MVQNILGDKKKTSFDDNLADYVNSIYDKMPDVIVPEKKIVVSSGNFSIEELKDVYVLRGVECGDELGAFTWIKKLLDGGKSHTQEEWVKITYELPDARDYYLSLLALYKNKDGPQAGLVEQVRRMFAEDFKNYLMMTSSRVNYKPGTNDELIHNYGSSSEDCKDIAFVGPCGYVGSENKFEDRINALFGTRNCKEVSDVFNWVTKKATYLWTPNKKPSSENTRTVVLGVVSIGVGFGIDAVDIGSSRPARGVIAVRELFVKNKVN
ncbi:hypothetical protein HZA97_09570 [Candidatus Woesearchaeota archaeon]|nr:hypothetical protein [Candidatus Woesearchaeota archaeon]